MLNGATVEARLVGHRGCTVAGRVLRDGVGVQHVTVTASSRSDNTIYPATPAVTDSQGAYRTANVRPGMVQVAVEPDKANPEVIASVLPPIALTGGKERDGLDLVIIGRDGRVVMTTDEPADIESKVAELVGGK